MLYKLFNIILVLLIFNINFTIANNNFCIENLKSTESNITSECTIKVKLISDKEKSVLNEICTTRGKLFNDTKIIMLKNGTFNSLKQLNCASNLDDIQLVWLSHENINNILKDSLNIHNEIIAKSTNDTLSDLVICEFNIRNHNCGIQFENQNGIYISHFNILAQLQPLDITISNIQYKPWKNTTNSGYKVPMSGKIFLPNYHKAVYKLFDTIKYSYFEKISLNITEIIPKEINNNLEIQAKINYNGHLIDIEQDGNAYAPISKEFIFSRTLPPLSGENATLIGESIIHVVDYSAMIQYNYGSGYKVNITVHDCKITIKTITDIDIIYSGPLPLNYTILQNYSYEYDYTIKQTINEAATLHEDSKLNKNENIQSTPKYINFQTTNNKQLKYVNGQVYPNFYPWFIVACIFISVISMIIFGNMIKVKIQERTLKKKRYRTGSLL